ncbi:MAG: cysteine desulfurase/selenocysteine lyase [Flavobacteriales bacterium]|jgi:cysteine desulfurase/selenocysteine lyase
MNQDFCNTQGYLNTAGAGLISNSTAEAGIKFIQDLHSSGSTAFLKWREQCLPKLFAKAATLLDAQESELAFPPNLSFSLQGIISGIPSTSKVFLIEDDYPSLTLPFRLGGYSIVKSGPTSIADYQDHIEAQIEIQLVDIVAVSHVQFKSGFTLDLDRLGQFCRSKGIISIVDCTQSLGAIPISFKKSQIDVLIASNYKWMNAGFGSGIVAATEGFFDKYPSKFGGFGSFRMQDGQLVYPGGIRSLEPGHQAYSSLSMLEIAMDEKIHLGVDKIWDHNSKLDHLLAEGLKKLGMSRLEKGTASCQSSISVISCNEQVGTGLAKRGIVNTFTEGHLRIAPHFYNDESDIELFINSLEEINSKATVPTSLLFLGKKQPFQLH